MDLREATWATFTVLKNPMIFSGENYTDFFGGSRLELIIIHIGNHPDWVILPIQIGNNSRPHRI